MTTARGPRVDGFVAAIMDSYQRYDVLNHLEGGEPPSREVIWSVVEDLQRVLFPRYIEAADLSTEDLASRTAERLQSIAVRLKREIEKGLCFAKGRRPTGECAEPADVATQRLLTQIPAIIDLVASDIQAAYDGDPAAQSLAEIILAYPGLQAIAVYRLAHVLYQEDVPIVPRVMTEYAHSRTGIDIHPGAKIGRRFFIDHGTGVVIGETSTIGDDVKIYQGVTLGARSFPRDERGRAIKGAKRHPDIDDGVTIYAGATILGDIRIGRNSIIGGNVWLTQGVPAETRIVGRTPEQLHIDRISGDYSI